MCALPRMNWNAWVARRIGHASNLPLVAPASIGRYIDSTCVETPPNPGRIVDETARYKTIIVKANIKVD